MVQEITSLAEFNKEINTYKGLIVIDFFTTWCGPCKAIAPFIESLALKYPNVKFLKVDIEKNEDIAMPRNIQSIPTFHFMLKGNLVDELKGANSSAIEQKVLQHKVENDPFQSTSGYKLASSESNQPVSTTNAREARLRAFASLDSSNNSNSSSKNNTVNSAESKKSVDDNNDDDIEEEALSKALNLSVADNSSNNTNTGKVTSTSSTSVDDDQEYAKAAAEYDAQNTTEQQPLEHVIGKEGQDTWDEEMVPVPVDETLLQQLIEMGFSDVPARKAIVHGKNMDGVMNWLSEHQDDVDINCPYLVKKSDIVIKKPLTEEEKAARVLAIKNLVKQRQNEKLKLEKNEEIRREKERRERGQKIDETLEERQRLQRKRDAEKMKKEKDDAAKERLRLKAEIARDKEIRKANKGVLPSVLGVDGYNPSIIQYDQPPTTSSTTTTAPVEQKKDTTSSVPSKRMVNAEEKASAVPVSSTTTVKKAPVKDTNNSTFTPTERVDQAIQTILRYRTGGDGGQALKLLLTFVRNIVNNPDDNKYKSINTESNAYKMKLASLVGPLVLLKAIGFEKGVEDESKLIYTGDSHSQILSETLTKLVNADQLYTQQNP